MVIRQQQFSTNEVRQVLGGVLGDGLHAKRVASLCDATLGVLRGASLAVCTIGHGLAAARGLNSKHATKQVDRLLSNPNINVDDILARWVPYIIGARNSIVVALDWTDFDADKQATIMLSLITDHGRATPLVWLTVDKDTLKDNRSRYEYRVLVRLAELLPRVWAAPMAISAIIRRPPFVCSRRIHSTRMVDHWRSTASSVKRLGGLCSAVQPSRQRRRDPHHGEQSDRCSAAQRRRRSGRARGAAGVQPWAAR